MEVAVLSTVEESLRRCTSPGLLVGVQGPQGIAIIGAMETSADAGALQEVLPHPLAVAGVFEPADGQAAPKRVGLVLARSKGPEAEPQWWSVDSAGAEQEELATVSTVEDWSEGWITLRVLVSASVTYVLGSEGSKAFLQAIGELSARLAGPESMFVTLDGTRNLKELSRADQLLEGGSGEKGAQVVLRGYAPLCTPAEPKAPEAILPEDPARADQKERTVTLQLDALCFARGEETGAWAAQQIVRPALMEQLARAAAIIEDEKSWEGLAGVHTFHFQPPGLAFPVTQLYPLPAEGATTRAEARLAERRAAAHAVLGLPATRPALKVASALPATPKSRAAPAADGRLRDVHVGAPASKVRGGTKHLVQGSYAYCHYMQDGFNDSGWGCAYRSLQTLWSWFALQGHTERPVPSHCDIQTTLVKMGDKELSFRGSKQWIGAMELGYVLEEELGVQCRVLPLRSGAELPDKARELAHHFDTQGTPVMVGGGVLAYTLLGVDWNEETGEVAFLILDPHYTGPENLKKIHSGQWVAWKQYGDKAAAGGKLLHTDAFYNLLLPQRPLGV